MIHQYQDEENQRYPTKLSGQEIGIQNWIHRFGKKKYNTVVVETVLIDLNLFIKNFGVSGWHCSRSPFRRSTGYEVKCTAIFTILFHSIQFFFITTFSHKSPDQIKKLIEQKYMGVPMV